MNSLALLEIYENEKKMVETKVKDLERIDYDYEEDHRGVFLFRLRARLKNKIFLLAARDYCPETSIRRVFRQLKKLLQKNKVRNELQ
ncbi:MAG: hypothetical protein Fur0010_17730 [Bdellovibrio sp.]